MRNRRRIEQQDQHIAPVDVGPNLRAPLDVLRTATTVAS